MLCGVVNAQRAVTQTTAEQKQLLWFTSPASAGARDTSEGWMNDTAWLRALPVGNGFAGAMVFGDVNRERLQLNDKTLWSGSPDDNDNPAAAAAIPRIRSLLFAGEYQQAQALTDSTQICKGKGSGGGNGAGVPFGCYQTLGDLRLDFGRTGAWTNYRRTLDLQTGIVSVTYLQDGVKYSREVFASYPDRVLVMRITASRPHSISFRAVLDRPERFRTTVTGNRLLMEGTLDNGHGGDGMRYRAILIPVLSGGRVTGAGNDLLISEADTVTLLVFSATSYRLHYPDYRNNNYLQELDSQVRATATRPYADIKSRHLADFSPLMKRSVLQMGDHSLPVLPAPDWLIQNEKTGNEQGLYATYYQLGRYLLLSSSRPGSLPANLQGIWANKIQTPWNGDYHTDINVQMNYWPAQVTGLQECEMQLVNLIGSLQEPGERTARVQYGLNGWCMHPITNVWGYTSPGEASGWGMHVAAAGWMDQHLWNYYSFTSDTAYLRRVWPWMKEACRFYLGWLLKDPATGKWVSGPSASPENSFYPASGNPVHISMGPSHDQEVIGDLFSHFMKAAAVLGVSPGDSVLEKVRAVTPELSRPGIAKDGRLMEWASEFREAELTHRHVSHLFDLYPGDGISFARTPELARAAEKSLGTRGDGGTGWSLAWKICLWARLHNGDHSLLLLNRLLQPLDTKEMASGQKGGSYNNWFDACPPFQIDGNLGATAGIAEMLLQSQEDFIELLPALPGKWTAGSITGLHARGGFALDIQWKESRLLKAILFSAKGGRATLRYGSRSVTIETVPGKSYPVVF